MTKNLPNYVFLAEAANYSGYSQEYLSLRARQRKLKAIKIARNWATTKEWIDEYFKKIGKVKVGKAKRRRKAAPKSHFIIILCLMVFILGCVSLILTSPYISIIAENIKELNIEENIFLGARVIGNWFLNFNFIQF
jgi:hypothetical protein